MMTIRQMRIFTAAARSGSFRACADELGLSQVVISSHIRAIEKHLGVDLFERRAGLAAELTGRGRHAYERIAAILADIDDLGRELSGPSGQRALRFLTYSFILLSNEERLDVFRRRFPEIELQIDIQPPDNSALAGRVQRGEVDFACFFALSEAEVPGSKFVRDHEMGIYVGVDHPLAGLEEVTGEMLEEHPAQMLPPSAPQRLLTTRVLAEIGCSVPKVFMETEALALMLHNVRRNNAWIALYADSVSEFFPGLARVRLAKPLPRIQVRSIARPSARHDPALRALQACLQLDDPSQPDAGHPNTEVRT